MTTVNTISNDIWRLCHDYPDSHQLPKTERAKIEAALARRVPLPKVKWAALTSSQSTEWYIKLV